MDIEEIRIYWKLMNMCFELYVAISDGKAFLIIQIRYYWIIKMRCSNGTLHSCRKNGRNFKCALSFFFFFGPSEHSIQLGSA